ncbi:hypothetical protein [Pseudomonas synxantha]|uniref:hypothetical protein n=1 Tax=Pseudomonas synxantha TaxID=47883 RepID=UPI00099D1725|nr:hypothetical protein [Pseudomonas synxantha]OPB08169.1 hypothetical protein BFW89_06550 [Pseudomonas synxantha]
MTTLRTQPLDFKTQYRLGFSPLDDKIVVDFFCGGGGAGSSRTNTWIGEPWESNVEFLEGPEHE